MKTYGKLLFRKLRPLQLIIAVTGTLIGLSMLLSATQLYGLFSSLLKTEKDIIGNQYLVIQKKISLMNTFSKSNASFSNSEIERLTNISGVKEVAALKSNLFRANAFIDKGENNLIPQLQTELFFESVPDRVLDINTDEWQWPKSDSVIPLIIPKDYLNLYNFGFAPGQDLPQISESTIGLFEFKIRIIGNNKTRVYKAFIAGFSSRINSILVPDNFLSYVNKQFAEKKQENPTRLIIVSNDPSNEKLQHYFQENGIETNEELLKSSRLNSMLTIMITIVSIIGFVIIFLAVMNIIQYAQLLIVQSEYEIKTLILIGYSYKSISFYYFKLIISLMLIILSLSYFILYQINNGICKFIIEKGYEADEAIYSSVHLCATVLFFSISCLSSGIVRLQIRKIAKIGILK